jgi:TolA-binding protein
MDLIKWIRSVLGLHEANPDPEPTDTGESVESDDEFTLDDEGESDEVDLDDDDLDTADAPEDTDIRGLESQLSDAEGDIGQLSNETEALRDDMSDMDAKIDDLDETIRELLGIYDAFAARVNPMAEGDVAPIPVDGDGTHTDDTYGLIDGDDHASGADPSADPNQPVEGATEGNDALSELRAATGADDTTAGSTEAPPSPSNTGSAPAASATHLPRTYVAETLALEWLSVLVARGGVAGALRALGYYEQLDWISTELKAQLHARLTGAFHDPSVREQTAATSSTLTTEDHKVSLSYVILLEEHNEA